MFSREETRRTSMPPKGTKMSKAEYDATVRALMRDPKVGNAYALATWLTKRKGGKGHDRK